MLIKININEVENVLDVVTSINSIIENNRLNVIEFTKSYYTYITVDITNINCNNKRHASILFKIIQYIYEYQKSTVDFNLHISGFNKISKDHIHSLMKYSELISTIYVRFNSDKLKFDELLDLKCNLFDLREHNLNFVLYIDGDNVNNNINQTLELNNFVIFRNERCQKSFDEYNEITE